MHHQWITAPNIGELVPIFQQEVTPGDTWKGKSTAMFRLSPLDLPAYMSLKVFVDFWFIPHSIVWDEFQDVITGKDTSTAWPTITYSAAEADHWQDQGHGVSTTLTPDNNALPIRAFNKVYNDIYKKPSITAAGEDSLDIRRVYFPTNDYFGGITDEIQQDTEETVDTSGATVGVTAIRDAMHRQRLKERRAQFGEEYQDMLRSYGVYPPATRLNRPEFCARGRTTIGISEVVATATSASENTGEYRGHGISGMRINFPKRYFSEHGTLLGVMYSRPRMQLKSRKDKLWYVTDKYDLYHPEHVRDTQEVVKSQEIYTDTVAESNFGYQGKYEWLRNARDTIAGDMQDSARAGYVANVDLSALPTVDFLQQVQDYDHLYQDQTSDRADMHSFFDHKISKLSIIKPRTK